MTDDTLDQMTRAAWLYYEHGLTQADVARRLAVSRSTVSRLLTAARRRGLVEITVTRPLPEMAALEAALLARYSLTAVTVEHREPGETSAAAAARAAARLLHRQGRMLRSVGVGWGSTLHAAAEQTPRVPADTTIIEVVGRPPGDRGLVAVGTVLARTWNAPLVSIPAPAYIESPQTAAALRADPVVGAALDRAREAELLLVSIGGANDDATLVNEGLLTRADMRRLRAAGVVGDVLGHFFDRHGAEVTTPAGNEIIGLGIGDLRRHPAVVLVAAGEAKVPAIHAALLAGFARSLITDQETAELLLALPA